MKRKSNHKKNKKQEEVDVTKEVGIFDDFIVMEKKESEKKKEEKKDISFLDDWVMLENPFSEKTSKTKSKKSRFTDLFEQIKEEEKKTKEEENIKNDDSLLNKTSSINTSSITTNYDSKSFESNSINSINDSSLSENNNNNQIKENKKNEQNEKNEQKEKEKIDEKDMTLEINKVISMEDKRTTIMIKNIPNKFNKDLLLSIINQNFKGTYDLFILPTDINKYKNFGYAFINFTSSYYIPYFYYMFNGKMWSSTNSKKICELTYSKVQGKKNLLGHYPIKIVYVNEEAKNVIPEQKYIIPNVYKIIFNKLFPEEKIEEYKFYFITKMPDQK